MNMLRPTEIARRAEQRTGQKNGDQTKAAIKVGRDSGRVKVFVRVRPMKPQENSRKETTAVDASELNSQTMGKYGEVPWFQRFSRENTRGERAAKAVIGELREIHVSDPKHSYEKDYSFDHVFPAGTSNNEVCNTLCKPIVSSALNGFNGTLMAYGQTGSGKTHTLMAPDGITSGVVDRCFKRITQDSHHDYRVSMSYLQIYQEKIYDLLNSTNKVDLSIREHPQKGVYVENLSEFVVRSPSEVFNLLAVGRKRLVFAETKMNRTSSRSHSVCTIFIERTLNKDEGTPKDCVPKVGRRSPLPRKDSKEQVHATGKQGGSPKKSLAATAAVARSSENEMEDEGDSLTKIAFHDDVLIRGKIHLCDLAGSERLKKTHAEGERLSEAQHINSSLLELGNVIHALADGKKTHVPFRNSTLTRLLQESLGGNCKTSLIVCVSPCTSDVSETKTTLNFGYRAMKITNTAYVNLEVDYKRLSDDLSKILDAREKDMVELKENIESRIEKIKSEAQTQMNTTMAEAQLALSSARSLFQSQENNLRDELSQIDKELHHEKNLSRELQIQLSTLNQCLHGGVHRAKSALLAELLSMQLFYTIRDMPEEERCRVAEELAPEYLYNGTQLISTKEKVLENTDIVLRIFQCYLKLLNSSGENLVNSGLDLKMLEANLVDGNSVVVNNFVNESRCLDIHVECLEDDDSIMSEFNKTDDDKVVESTKDDSIGSCQLVPDEESKSTTSSSFLSKTKSLRDKLLKIKSSLDGDAVEFLQKAFGKDSKSDATRENVYSAMKEFLQERESIKDLPQDEKLLPLLSAEMALLDQSLCQVLIDKALQSSILLLEHTESQRECDKLSNDNVTMNKEMEILRVQVETLVTENAKLNSKLSETSTFLLDVKTSKSRLEDDLSSVFQLYNMRASESPRGEAACTMKQELETGISSLVEENAKLKVELKDAQAEKKELQTQLSVTKGQLENMTTLVESLRNRTETLPATKAKEDANTSYRSTLLINGNAPDTDDLQSLEQFLFYVQQELVKLESNESALSEHSSQRQVISSLRSDMNKRLGEEWSVKIIENSELRLQMEELSKTLDIERREYDEQIEQFKNKLHVELQARINLEEELLMSRKQIVELDLELWESYSKRSDSGVSLESAGLDFEHHQFISSSEQALSKDERGIYITKRGLLQKLIHRNGSSLPVDTKLHWKHEIDGNEKLFITGRQQSVLVRADSINENDLDVDSIKDKKDELLQAERESDSMKQELARLKKRFLELGEELADSGKVREELGQRFSDLVNEEMIVSSKLDETEQKCVELQHKLDTSYRDNEELERTVDDIMRINEVLEREIQSLKGSISALEEERSQVKQQLSSAEVRITLMDSRYREKCKELDDTKKALQHTQDDLQCSKSEFKDLHEAYESLRIRQEDDSDRESLVEVKMRSPIDSPLPRRLHSIHLVSRARAQGRKAGQSTGKKKLSFRINSPRQEETLHDGRNDSLKRRTQDSKWGTLNRKDSKRNTLTRQETKRGTLTRLQDLKRDSLKRGKTLEKRDSTDGKIKVGRDEDSKLKSELLLAKEQLIRLKAELTVSNMQTTNIGTQLTSLREDSNKLEAELNTMSRTPNRHHSSGDSSNTSDGALRLEIDLADAKEKVIFLQEKLMILRREKATADEKNSESEEQIRKLRCQIYKTNDALERSHEEVKILKNEVSNLKVEQERLLKRLAGYTNEIVQSFLFPELEESTDKEGQREMKNTEKKSEQWSYMMNDRMKLQREIEDLSENKIKLEDMQNLVQQLVSVEDEKNELKQRLRLAVKDSKACGTVEGQLLQNGGDTSKQKGSMKRTTKDNSDQKCEEFYIENTALRCEVDALRIYIANLENEIKSMKFKLSVSESTHGNTDKKVLATLLASAKHEREELRRTLNELYSEKEDIEEELEVAKVRCGRLQRELANMIKEKVEMEKEIRSLKKGLWPQKDGQTSLSAAEEKGLMELIKGFLFSIGVQNAGEDDVKELVEALIARKNNQAIQRGNKKTTLREKSKCLDYRQAPLDKKPNKPEHITNRSSTIASAQASVSNSKTQSHMRNSSQIIDWSHQSGLKRHTPGYEREMPEGMEDVDAYVSTLSSATSKTKQEGTTAELDEFDGEVYIKRTWSLKNIFKRANGKNTPAEPLV